MHLPKRSIAPSKTCGTTELTFRPITTPKYLLTATPKETSAGPVAATRSVKRIGEGYRKICGWLRRVAWRRERESSFDLI